VGQDSCRALVSGRQSSPAARGLVRPLHFKQRRRLGGTVIVTLVYNLVVALADAVALVHLAHHRTISAWLSVSALGVVAVLVLALTLGVIFERSLFAAIRLAAYGVFLHGVVVLAGSAILLWPAQPTTAAGSALAAVLAFLIEPTRLEVSRIRLTTEKLRRPVRIVVLADLQTDVIGPYERDVLERTLHEKPDLILLAGDYLQAKRPEWETLQGQLNAFLRKLDFSAPGGVFAVRGNCDPADWAGIFEGLPVTTAEATRSFALHDLRLTCLSEKDARDTSLEIGGGDPGRYHVVLGHAPDYALGRVEADLLVAGHTHGGQVRLPLVGPLMTQSKVPRRWAAGLTELPGGARLLVSRGVGMERSAAPRLRFLCRPELVVIDLVPR
jgi:predicted MPP superfamily phosphohydrolase